METISMIEELNEAVDRTLSISYYYNEWCISSYRDKSLFNTWSSISALIGVTDETLEGAIKKAYKIMKEA